MPLTGLSSGALGLCALVVTGAATPYRAAGVATARAGFGTGHAMPAAAAAIAAAPDRQAGTASGAFNASRQLGGTIAVAVFGALVASRGGVLAASHVGALIGGLVFAVGALITLVTVPRRGPE